MRSKHFRGDFKVAVLTALAVLLLAGASFAQQQINLTAAPTGITLPDGSTIPMWGYSCTGVTGTALPSGSQTCAALSPGSAGWSPVVITSTPAEKISSAVFGVIPEPPAEFSPLAMTKSRPL